MATRFLVDPDGSFLLVEPGSVMLVEADFAAFAYKTIDVGPRVADVALAGRQVPLHVDALARRVAVGARAAAVSVGASSRRVRANGL